MGLNNGLEQLTATPYPPQPEVGVPHLDFPAASTEVTMPNLEAAASPVFVDSITEDLFTNPPEAIRINFNFVAQGNKIILPNGQALIFSEVESKRWTIPGTENEIIIHNWKEVVEKGRVGLVEDPSVKAAHRIKDFSKMDFGEQRAFLTNQKAIIRIPSGKTVKIFLEGDYHVIVDFAAKQYTIIPALRRQTISQEGDNILISTSLGGKEGEEIKLALAESPTLAQMLNKIPPQRILKILADEPES